MSIQIDSRDFLKKEAAQKLLEILGSAGLVDLSEIHPPDTRVATHQARVLAASLLEAIRPQLQEQILEDAEMLYNEARAIRAEIDGEV